MVQVVVLRRTAFVCLLFSLFSSPGTGALAQTSSPWVELSIFNVKPSMVEEFQAVQREFKARAQKAEVGWRSVSKTEIFGPAHQFIVITPIQSLSGFDRPQRSAPDLTALTRRLENCLVSEQTYAALVIPEASRPPDPGEDPGLMIVSLARVAPGREQEYLSLLKSDFLPHFDAAEKHYLTASLAFGGENGFVHFFYVDNFAELDQGSPVMRELGAEGAQQVMARFSGTVTRSEQWIVRYLPDLSHKPPVKETRN